MSKKWWEVQHESRHPRTLTEVHAYLGHGKYAVLPKGSFIAPVKKDFLPSGHWARTYYDETTQIAADTSVGFAILDLKDVSWR